MALLPDGAISYAKSCKCIHLNNMEDLSVESVFLVSRFIHIAAGFIALFVAPGAMLTAKGSLWHRRWGKVYFWAMAVVGISAVVMTFYRLNPFLFLLAVLSFYLSFSGYRVLSMKRPHRGEGAKAVDWGVSGLTFVASTVLALYGAWGVWLAGDAEVGLIALILGIVGVLSTGSDLWRYWRPPTDKRAWWYLHMSGFLGAYITTVSAFSAVNFTFLPFVVRWLWPTVVGVIGMTIWQNYYRRKFTKTGRQRTSVA